MQKLTFQTTINTPPQLVWDTMLQDMTYRDWTRMFSAYGSYFLGTWEQGTEMKFIGLDEHGASTGGLSAEVVYNEKPHKLRMNYVGLISADGAPVDGVTYKDAYENYTFTSCDQGTQITIDLDIDESWASDMAVAWPRALARLKVICEKPESITVQVSVHAPLTQVWGVWTSPEHIMKWNQASPDWHCPKAINEVKVGGRFCSTMAARDGSVSFDFTGTYLEVTPEKHLLYIMDDGRSAAVTFEQRDGEVHITTTFQMETENSRELQQSGWQSILESFKLYSQKQQNRERGASK